MLTVIQHGTLILSTETYFTRDNQSAGIKIILLSISRENKLIYWISAFIAGLSSHQHAQDPWWTVEDEGTQPRCF